MSNSVPGPPASVLAAILAASPSHPYDPATQARRATFSGSNFPDLPSLTTDVVALPENAYLDANVEVGGTLASNGWATGAVVTVTAAYTPGPSIAVVLANASGGAFTVTLPDATQVGFVPGQRYTVKKTDPSANVVTLAASAGQLIDGASTQAVSPAQSAISVVFTGAEWEVTSGGSAIGTNSVGGVTVSGTPSAGQVLTATSPSAADWAAGGLVNPMTTLGDLITGGAAGVAGRLGIGTAGQVLTASTSGTGTWANAPVDWQNVVTGYGADPTGAADSTAAFNNAIAAIASGGTVYMPPGTYLIGTSTDMSTFGPGQNLIADGSSFAILYYVGNGTCVSVYESTYSGSAGGTFRGFTIGGAGAGASAVGMSWGNLLRARCHDIAISDFTGASATGLQFTNGSSSDASEQAEWTGINLFNNTVNVLFSTGSFDYSIYQFLIVAGNKQDGVRLTTGASLVGCRLEIRGNFTAGTGNTASVMSFDPGNTSGTSSIYNGLVYVDVECDGASGTGHYTISMDGGSSSNFSGVGVLQFLNQTVSFQGANIRGGGPVFSFAGYFNDSVLGGGQAFDVYGNSSIGAIGIYGIASLNAGSSTAGSAPILTGVAGTNGGGGVQLSDKTRDYIVYLQVGTAGTAWIVTMGHTSGASDVTVHASGVATAGQTLSFRLPAAWYFAWSATTATLAQSVAVGC